MKQKSVLTRCLALALALLLAVSSANLGLVSQVFAEEAPTVYTITDGELMAENYKDMGEHEKALLKSGYLVESAYDYTMPTSDLVDVDTENQTIKAAEHTYEGQTWVPVSATIDVPNSDDDEIVALTNGEGQYNYNGNAFAVKVTYELSIEVAAAQQEKLAYAAATLNQGLNAMKSAYDGSDANMENVLSGLSLMVDLAKGTYNFHGIPIAFQSEAAKTAALALDDQTKANNGKLDLQVHNEAYKAANAKSQYLVQSGYDYSKAIKGTYHNLLAIISDAFWNEGSAFQTMLNEVDPEALQKMINYSGIIKNVVSGLEDAATNDYYWTLFDAEGNQNTVASSANYADLDAKLAAFAEGGYTDPAVKNPLLAAACDVQVNLSMNNVNISLTVSVASDDVDSDALVPYYSNAAVVTLATGSTPEAIEAAIAANGIEANAVALLEERGIDLDHYQVEKTELKDNLSEDITYVIAYSPKQYEVDYCGTKLDKYYGSWMTLEKHDDPTQAYDYTVTAGGSSKPYMQGAVIEILSDTTIIAREVGRAYAVKQLYAIIADNFGNAVTDEILLSGALFGDENIYYREPMQEDVDNENDPLIVLENGKLTAKNYDPSLVGAMWAPYTYGEKGTENSFAGATADWAEKSAGVQYKLNLPEAYADRAYEILKLVQSLQDDAAAQVAALNKMNENYEALGTLDKTKLGAMNGVIGVTDMTPGDDTETDAKNLELRQYFSGVVSNLIANSLDSNNYLKIYNILTAYNSTTGGLKYYYDNSESVINEINVLSGYLNEMVADDEKIVALEILTKAAGYPEYAERIVNLEAAMAQVKEDLVAPNAMINLNSDKLATLVKALQADGEATEPVKAVPYVLSKTLMVADSSIYYITVNVSANGKSDTLYSNRIEGGNGASVNIADLQAQIDAFVASAINGEGSVDKVPYYTLTADTKLESIDPVLTGKVTVNYTYTPTDYTVIVNGVENTINVNNLYVNLPKSNNEDEEYIYIIDGVENDAGDYGFTLKQLDELFVDGKYTVGRKVIDLVDDKLVALVDALNAAAPDGDHYDLDDERTGIVANISASANVAESIAMAFVNSGYSYIGLNENDLMYMNAENSLELSIQALINALLEDETFGSKTLIALRDNNGGKLLKTTLMLGDAKDDLDFELDFLLNLNGVPSQMVTVANALEAVEDYMTFQSSGKMMVTRHVGRKAHMDITLNLPEKVYEAYLTAMLATGTVDKSDVNLINHKIAYEFFEDYLNTIVENDNITAQTFENTLKRMDNAVNDKTDYDLPDYDLSAYDNYYQAFKNALKQNVTITANADDLTFDFDANGKTGIDALVKMLGVDISSFGTYLGMVKEYKEGAEPVVAQVVATLTDLNETKFEAAMVDIRNDAKKNKLDYTTDLVARAGEITGKSLIVLLADIEGELVLNHPAIIDLNGKKIDKLTANAKVLVLDSNLDNAKSGSIGTLSGSVYLTAGNYGENDVSAFVADGYKQNEDGFVQNALYTLEADQNGNLSLTVDSGVIYENIDSYTQFALAVASDLAADLIANYYTSAALYVADAGDVDDNLPNPDNKIYDIDFNDFVDLLDSDSIPTEVLNEALEVISLPDLADTINEIMQDLLDLNAIEKAIREHKAVASYTLQTQPWAVNLEHVFDNNNDYLTCGIVANENNAKKITLTLTVDGPHNEKAADAVAFLSTIVLNGTRVELVDVEELTYEDKYFNLTGGAEFDVILDLSDYTTYMAIVMANGTDDDKRADLVNAVNSGNQNDLKAAFDVLTVKDVINALKVLQRNDDLATLASNVGMNVNINLEGKKELVEKVLIAGLAAAGKALEKLEITGTEAKLGNLDKDGDGWYEYEAQYSRRGDVSRRGYGLNYNLTTAAGYVKVNLFGCKLGDVNHDGFVDNRDAMLVLRYDLGKEITGYFCEIGADVNGDGSIDNRDAMLILQYDLGKISKFPAEE